MLLKICKFAVCITSQKYFPCKGNNWARQFSVDLCFEIIPVSTENQIYGCGMPFQLNPNRSLNHRAVFKSQLKKQTESNHSQQEESVQWTKSKFLAITFILPKEQWKSCMQVVFCFGFVSRWLKNWCKISKPITKHSNRNHMIIFDSQLKTTLLSKKGYRMV